MTEIYQKKADGSWTPIFNGTCPFPVGVIMPMAGSQNPNDIWHGTTWTKLANGTFLMADDDGGKVPVGAEVPQHKHNDINFRGEGNYKLGKGYSGSPYSGVISFKQADGGAIYDNDTYTGIADNSTYTNSGKVIPSGTIKVCMWERIA